MWNVVMEITLEKRRIEVEKNEGEHFQLLMKIATNCKFLVAKTVILSNRKNIVFILSYKKFPKLKERV